MKTLFCILFWLFSFIINFGLNKIKLKFWYIFLPMLLLIPMVFTIDIVVVKILNIKTTHNYREIGESIIIASGMLTLLFFARITFPEALDSLIKFHKTYNAQNIDRFPISFFVYQRDKIILGLKIILFLGYLFIIYEIFFNRNN